MTGHEGLVELLGQHIARDHYGPCDEGSVGTYCTCGGWEGGYFADGEQGPFDGHLADVVLGWSSVMLNNLHERALRAEARLAAVRAVVDDEHVEMSHNEVDFDEYVPRWLLQDALDGPGTHASTEVDPESTDDTNGAQMPTFPSGEADCAHPRWVEWSAFGFKAGDRRRQCHRCGRIEPIKESS